MADWDKVIKAIETHLSTDISVGCDDCTYDNDGLCTTRLLADILVLLKEQEAKPVIVTINAYGTRFYHCPRCNRDLCVYPIQLYCSNCGQEVKWNDR